MKHLKKYLALICALCLIFGTFAGCSSEEPEVLEKYDANKEMVNVASGIVAENSLYSIEWNKDRAAVSITSKKDGTVWSTTPKEYLDSTTREDIPNNDRLNSLLVVTCRNELQAFTHYSSTACVVNNRYSSEKIDNGIRVTFYFDEAQLVAGLDIYLEDDVFKVKVDPSQLKSYSEYFITKVTPAQFLCSVKNTEAGDKNSYVVVPSGSGALLYTDLRSDKTVRSYAADFYGSDKAVRYYQRGDVVTPLNMGFYGIKNGDNALCAIFESGVESSGIDTKTGDVSTGYSYVSAYYNARGFENVFYRANHRYRYTKYAEDKIEPFVVAYYPLTGDKANYTGMAKKYREVMTKKGQLKKSQDNTLLTVKLIGSYLEDDLFLGIPTTKKVSLTSYKEAKEILSELSEISGGNLAANMYAYGEGGLNGLKLNGDNKLTGVVGNKKALLDFVKFTNDSGIKAFFNFDSITYAANGNGYNLKGTSALSTLGLTSATKDYSPATGSTLSSGRIGGVRRAMISRGLLAQSVGDTVSVTDKYGISNIAYNTLGNYCYSDYNDDNDKKDYYPVKAKMGAQVSSIIENVKTESGKTVMVDGAFDYAAAAADLLVACPTSSEKRFAFDKDIPLYQIVFQGLKANTTSSINGAGNQRKQFLKAIETGSGLYFTVIANYSTELRKQIERGLGTALYEDNKEQIKAYVNEAKDFLTSVSGASIKSHEYIADEVTVTTFDNGVTVVVNHGEKTFTSESYGTVKAESFITK